MRNSAVYYEDDRVPATIAVRDAPTYQARPRELVVRVEAVGINPADYRVRDGQVNSARPHGGGSDLVGIVEQIGEGVKGFVLGERVAGYTPFHYSLFFNKVTADSARGILQPESRYAAFQHHAVVFAEGVMKVPWKVSVPEAATLGCAYITAALALWGELKYRPPSLQRPFAYTHTYSGTLLVWGGSSCVGSFAIQLARLSGIRVVATTSPQNFQYVKSLGADRVYDYRALDTVERLRSEGIVDVVDAISERETPRRVRDVLRGRGGRVVVMLPVDVEWPPEIKCYYVSVPRVYKDEYRELVRWLYHDFSPRFLGEGLIRPSNVHLVEGGLERVKDMMNMQKEGRISAKKPVLVLKGS